MMNVESICAEYLRSVSPMAQRIAEDIDSVRFAYKDLWDNLDTKDKNQVVDEALIDPAAVVKYANGNKENAFELEPLSSFSWFTQSQLNLFTHLPQRSCEIVRTRKTPIKCSDLISPAQKKRLTSPMAQHETAIRSPQERTARSRQLSKTSIVTQEKFEGHHEISGSVQKGTIIAKPKNPPPPPPQSAKSEMRALLDQDDIPKTGFDFLDNW